jgi:glycosyltransferase involved in cell wall biosynthesis
MTQLAAPARPPFPASYKDFTLVRNAGRVYGVPRRLDAGELQRGNRLHSHPAVLSAGTLAALQRLIDEHDVGEEHPRPAPGCPGYSLVRHGDVVLAVPESARGVNLDLEDERRRAGVVSGRTIEEVQERIRASEGATPVEFAGWLPVYEFSGNCGRHPQFTHTADPPAGYRFTYSSPPRAKAAPSRWGRWSAAALAAGRRAAGRAGRLLRPLLAVFRRGAEVPLRVRLRVLGSMARLAGTLLWRGARPLAVLRFLQSRHYQSQLLLGACDRLAFLTSMPYTYGQNPWVVEIEDPTTLFYPLVENGETGTGGLRDSPYFPVIKTLLESDACRGVLTHMRSTAEMVPALFGSETIARKVHYHPLGVRLPERWQRHDEDERTGEIHLLFINSWCQVPANFFVRGGLDVLEAFDVLRERYPQLRLTVRSNMPGLDHHYHRIIERGWVRVIDRFLSAEEMAELHAQSHIFLLPAARVHILSLLQAMSYGLAVVTSDGWGIEEYVRHGHNGLVVPGRYGKTSWVDEQAAMLREDYEPMYETDPGVVGGLVEAVSRLVEDRALRRRLGAAGRRDVQTVYSLENWNRGLGRFFDAALGRGDGDGERTRG